MTRHKKSNAKSRKIAVARRTTSQENVPTRRPKPKNSSATPPKLNAESRLVERLLDGEQESLVSSVLDFCQIAETSPATLRKASKFIAKNGLNFVSVAEQGNRADEMLAQRLLAMRRQVIEELEIQTVAEFMLLDAAMDSYLHWLVTTGLTRGLFKDGTSKSKAVYQARISSIAQSYLKAFMDAMKALVDMKRPPIRVLKVHAGENVAVQVNERLESVPKSGQRAEHA